MKIFARLALAWLVGGAAVGCSAGASDDNDPGGCYLRELICASCESTTNKTYCGKRAQCTNWCNGMKGRATTVYCEWHDDGVCSQDIPAVSAQLEVCAIAETTRCGGSSGTSRALCDSDCSIRPGSNDYDAEFDCYTEYGSKQGHGKSCSEAIADLEGPSTTPDPPATEPDPPATEPEPPASVCSAVAGDTKCIACAKNQCCTQLEACGANAECVALFSCIPGCEGDATCQKTCTTDHQSGVSLLNGYLNCGNTRCKTECTP